MPLIGSAVIVCSCVRLPSWFTRKASSVPSRIARVQEAPVLAGRLVAGADTDAAVGHAARRECGGRYRRPRPRPARRGGRAARAPSPPAGCARWRCRAGCSHALDHAQVGVHGRHVGRSARHQFEPAPTPRQLELLDPGSGKERDAAGVRRQGPAALPTLKADARRLRRRATDGE